MADTLSDKDKNGISRRKAVAPRARAGLTLLIPSRYPVTVIRLFLAVLCSLGLALSPAVTSGAIASPTAMPGCTMDGHMPAKPADHSKMDCCTPACQISAAAALLPERIATDARPTANRALHAPPALARFASFSPSGLDPPPRTHFS